MALSTVIFWTGLLSLLGPTNSVCIDGSPKECQEADFVPGSNLAGEGFDITKMQRKGTYVINMKVWRRKDKTCTICSNTYMQKKQKLPLAVVNWRPNHQCSLKVSSSIYHSSESLVSSTTSKVENNWKTNLDVNTPTTEVSLMLAGTNSHLAEYSMEKTKKDRFSFTSHHVSCRYYSYGVTNQPLLDGEFKRALQHLPKEYNQNTKSRYYKLIDNFGTHYITKVELGGSVSTITSIRQCEAALQGLTTEEVKMCLDVEASASIKGTNTLKTEYKHCTEEMDKSESKSSFSSRFNDRFTEINGGHTSEPELLFSADKAPGAYKEWQTSLTSNPDITSYSLDSLHELLPASSPVRKNLRRAISHYILEKALWKNCSTPCQYGVKTDPKDSCVCSCHNNPGITPDCCPKQKGTARLKITVVKGGGLWGDYHTGTDGYVKVFLGDKEVGRTYVVYNNNHPHWGQVFDQGSVILTNVGHVRFEVWDEDNKWDDDLLGLCDATLMGGVKEDLCNLNHGTLYYKLEVECSPNLAGSTCTDYIGSPMNTELEKTYVSRHARPVPHAILEKMGVLVSANLTYANESRAVIGRKASIAPPFIHFP